LELNNDVLGLDKDEKADNLRVPTSFNEMNLGMNFSWWPWRWQKGLRYVADVRLLIPKIGYNKKPTTHTDMKPDKQEQDVG